MVPVTPAPDKALKTIVLLPLFIATGNEVPSNELPLIVDIVLSEAVILQLLSPQLNTYVGVVSLERVGTGVTSVRVGPVLSTVKVAPLVGVELIAFPTLSVPFERVIVPVPSPVGTL